MSVFYIDTSEGVFELTSTSSIRVVESSRATDHPIEDGERATDNIVNENLSVTFDGVISDIKRISTDEEDNQRSVEDFILSLRKVRNNKELFTLYYDDREFGVAENCLITNVQYERQAREGRGYKVNLSFKQLRVVEQANVTTTLDNQTDPDKTQGKTDSSGNNTESVEDQFGEDVLILSEIKTIGDLISPPSVDGGG